MPFLHRDDVASPPSRGGRRRLLPVAAAAVLGIGLALPLGGSALAAGETPAPAPTDTGRVDPTQYTAGRYVVLLDAAPAASASRTKVARGQQLDADSAAVRAYSSQLRSRHDALAKRVGFSIKRHYTLSTNGFVADLTAKQATTLAADRSVLVVQKDSLVYADGSVDSTAFLGLSGQRGVWQQLGGQARAGQGVVVGIIDSGIWPESRSFAGKPLTATPQGRWGVRINGEVTTMTKADGGTFRGRCETGEQFTVANCNTKLISARSFVTGFGASRVGEDDFLSPRDGDGHGSHTASTAAGEPISKVVTEGVDFGGISGVAPGARIASYKALWETADGRASGATSDLVAAIEQAVADGVDVINYSVSGNTDTNLDAAELAFEGAAEAGVFVAASAGNEGPGPSTVAHNSPWLTTVAASTYTRFENTAVLGDGQKLVGASIATAPLPSTPLVDAAAVGNGSASATDTGLCKADSLDPAKVSGKVVVCKRGVYDRVAKSREVKRAGGVGMLLVNPTENSLDSDFHVIPTVHLGNLDAPKVAAYLASAGSAATVSFQIGNTTGGKQTPVPQVAGFSSRGPAVSDDGDLLKPDVSAPGVSVMAAVAPPSNSGREYDLYSGTSMSAPHVAGLAALIQGEHPLWTPMQIKSAMMTTAYDLSDAAGNPSDDVFAQGAGHVDAKAFLDPGLFVTSDWEQWDGYLAGLGLDTGVEPIAANEINLPSLAEGDLMSSMTLKRTFTSAKGGTWRIRASVPGFRVTSSVSTITARKAGEKFPVSFTFQRTTAPLGTWAPGHVTLTGTTRVRLPVALRPVSVKAPAAADGTGVAGSTQVPLTGGFNGTQDVVSVGLVKGQVSEGSLAVGDSAFECITIGAGNDAARFELVAPDQTSDLDMTVYSAGACDTQTVTGIAGTAATSAASETLTIEDADPGVYIVQVDAFAAGDQGEPVGWSLRGFDLGGAPEVGALTVTPDPVPVQIGVQTSFTASWTGLEPGAEYLARFTYAGTPRATYLHVTTPAAG